MLFNKSKHSKYNLTSFLWLASLGSSPQNRNGWLVKPDLWERKRFIHKILPGAYSLFHWFSIWFVPSFQLTELTEVMSGLKYITLVFCFTYRPIDIALTSRQIGKKYCVKLFVVFSIWLLM